MAGTLCRRNFLHDHSDQKTNTVSHVTKQYRHFMKITFIEPRYINIKSQCLQFLIKNMLQMI